jgi:hypothetical protein
MKNWAEKPPPSNSESSAFCCVRILVNLKEAEHPWAEHIVAEPQHMNVVGNGLESEDPTDPYHQSVWPKAS